jgi:hypothetical protein
LAYIPIASKLVFIVKIPLSPPAFSELVEAGFLVKDKLGKAYVFRSVDDLEKNSKQWLIEKGRVQNSVSFFKQPH